MTGVLLVAAGLLVVAGAAKALRPYDTARALRVAPAVVRFAAAGEVAIGATAMFLTAAAMAVAVSYAAFAVFVAVALVRGWALSSCGCFGEPDTPPTWSHVATDVVLGAGACAAAFTDRSAPLVLAVHHPAWGAALVLLATVTGGLAYLVMARLPRLVAEL